VCLRRLLHLNRVGLKSLLYQSADGRSRYEVFAEISGILECAVEFVFLAKSLNSSLGAGET